MAVFSKPTWRRPVMDATRRSTAKAGLVRDALGPTRRPKGCSGSRREVSARTTGTGIAAPRRSNRVTDRVAKGPGFLRWGDWEHTNLMCCSSSSSSSNKLWVRARQLHALGSVCFNRPLPTVCPQGLKLEWWHKNCNPEINSRGVVAFGSQPAPQFRLFSCVISRPFGSPSSAVELSQPHAHPLITG
ncbi:hypothetical protein VFPFJ_06501 [Purpureocillium lilacinum]|uniref:Uncharacterized protein n=1 Tax=Purpureocillium lilacinum TaxID=33203 RepID=A0A179HKA0_PURLI|nr:hypothetical protein VFPFJ_06501 [Purpureocillium lilacinum]OAQ90088.1 hypothetical protein VFPFJ_06501 [Purpureocillium lilacinum]